MQEEIWKDVVGYEGYYQVNNFGLIKSLERMVKYKENHSGLRKERILKTNITKGGYVHATICIDKMNKTVKAHRLVAIAFIPNSDNKPSVNHINGIKHDNRVENLEWCTAKENTNHAYKTNLKSGIKGEKSHLSKLKYQQVCEIRDLNLKGVKRINLASKYNVSLAQINRIVNYVNWVQR